MGGKPSLWIHTLTSICLICESKHNINLYFKIFQKWEWAQAVWFLKTGLKMLSFLKTLYILACFVKDKVPIGCGFISRLCSIFPLLYISVFVSVPYCLDDCSFVVYSEVRMVDSSSSIFLSQDCFVYSGSFVLPYKL